MTPERGVAWSLSFKVLVGVSFAVLVALVAAGAVGGRTPSMPRRIDVIVNPHPDDEMEAWSVIEDDEKTFHVFVYLTLGEATGFCSPDLPGYQAGTGERRPAPIPDGKHSKECEDDRVESTLLFLNQMAESDSGLPGGFDPAKGRIVGPFPDRGKAATRIDDGRESAADRSALIYDGGERGMAVFWNMGDGDLTRDEVEWVVDTIVANREELGIPDLPWGHVIGASFYHDGEFDDCMTYDHPDHKAVRDALWTEPVSPFEEIIVPTCRRDPHVTREDTVRHFEDGFRLGGPAPDGHFMRLGAHNIHYGWLYTPYYAGDWVDQGAQGGELFHRNQFFWVRDRDSGSSKGNVDG